jgi:L-amino acid N-acyltransferase YncA
MDVMIRQATVHDAQGVVDVINSVVQEGGLVTVYPALTLEQGESLIEGLGPRSALFIAEVNDAVLGVQIVEPLAPDVKAKDHVAVVRTYVYRNLRRQGVGRKLVNEALGLARQQGYEKAVALVRASSSAAQAFYRELGFIPKMMLERQIKIEGQYDDEVWMDMFITPLKRVEAAEPEVVAEPEEPVAVPAVDPIVGAVTVRRATRRDVKTLAAIMRGTVRWRPAPSEDNVLDMLFEKGYWLALSRKGGGLTGWRAENLVMCIDDFYVYPPQYYPQVGGPLLETVETEAKALSCEVAIAFLEDGIAPQAVQFFEAQGYERQDLGQLFSVWREVASEFLADGKWMMVKKLRERRIMRPL